MDISLQELVRRIRRAFQRTGLNQQGGATTGRRTRGALNIGDFDPRQLGLGLGRNPQQPETEPTESVGEPGPLRIKSGDDENVDALGSMGGGEPGLRVPGPSMQEEGMPRQRETDLGADALGETAGGSVGDAPAPEGEGMGAGSLSGMAPGFGLGVIGGMAGIPGAQPFTLPMIAKFMYDSIRESIRESNVLPDPSDVLSDIESPPLTDPSDVLGVIDSSQLTDPSTVLTDIEGVAGASGGGGNVGGSSSPGGFGGPMGGGGQEGDTGASNTGTVGEGDGK